MSKEAMKLALEAMGLIGADLVCEAAHHERADRHGVGEPCPIQARWHHAFAALRKALANEALERMAENARELGLDYDTSAGTQVSKVWWDGEKLMAKPIPLAAFYEQDQQGVDAVDTLTEEGWIWDGDQWQRAAQPQQEPVVLKWQRAPIRTAWGDDMVVASVASDNDHTLSLYCERDQTPKVDALFAQRTWVGLTDKEEVELWESTDSDWELMKRTESKLKSKNENSN